MMTNYLTYHQRHSDRIDSKLSSYTITTQGGLQPKKKTEKKPIKTEKNQSPNLKFVLAFGFFGFFSVFFSFFRFFSVFLLYFFGFFRSELRQEIPAIEKSCQ